MLVGSFNVASAHAVPGCSPATVVTRNTPDTSFTVKGPAVVEVWYPDAAANGKPSWGDKLRKVFVPGGMTGKFFDAQGKTWKWKNTAANRHCAYHGYTANPTTAVSRTTLKNQRVARFWSN